MRNRTWFKTEVQISQTKEQGFTYVTSVTINTDDKDLHDEILSVLEGIREDVKSKRNPVVV